MTEPLSYKSVGVDIQAGDALVDFLKTKLPDIGGFSGAFPIPLSGIKDPHLVASTDGVGTKLMIAAEAQNYKTVGQDLVGMVVNDLMVCGAKPLFFLDYIGTGHLEEQTSQDILQSILDACEVCGCSLLGGETAEMPGFYQKDNIELVGFAVGLVDKSKIIDGSTIESGDVVIGVPSSGIHSNGYSLVRKILFDHHDFSLTDQPENFDGKSVQEILLEPTELYVPIGEFLKKQKAQVKGYAHITGGGLPGNLNRVLPKNCSAQIQTGSWEIPKVFQWLQNLGNVEPDEMFRVFNMGIGLTIVCSAENRDQILSLVQQHYPSAAIIGKIIEGDGSVELI